LNFLAVVKQSFSTVSTQSGRFVHACQYRLRMADDRFSDEQSGVAIAAGVDSEEAMYKTVDLLAYENAIAGSDPLLKFLFNNWFKQPIIKSVFIEASGGTVKQLKE